MLSLYMLVTGVIPFTHLIGSRGYKIKGNWIRFASVLFLIVIFVPVSIYIKAVFLILAHAAMMKAAIKSKKKHSSVNIK